MHAKHARKVQSLNMCPAMDHVENALKAINKLVHLASTHNVSTCIFNYAPYLVLNRAASLEALCEKIAQSGFTVKINKRNRVLKIIWV